MNDKERFEALEARVEKIELVVAKILQLVKNQNEAAKVKTLKKEQTKRERKERYLSGLN